MLLQNQQQLHQQLNYAQAGLLYLVPSRQNQVETQAMSRHQHQDDQHIADPVHAQRQQKQLYHLFFETQQWHGAQGWFYQKILGHIFQQLYLWGIHRQERHLWCN